MVEIITEDATTEVAGRADGEALWLDAAEAERATGWSLKPEGMCRGPVCVPVPVGRAGALVKDGAVDVAGFWRHLDRAVAHDGAVWVLGAAAAERAEALRGLTAQDFALPDLDGKTHRLSEHAGKKVLLATWASW